MEQTANRTYKLDTMIKVDESLCIGCVGSIRAETLGLPEKHIPYGTFVIGYPAEKYQRIPVRKPVDVTWQ